MSLKDQLCEPCKGGVPPLTKIQQDTLLLELTDWQVIEEHHLIKSFSFSDFKEGLAFTNRIGELAESVGHHPDIYLTWGKVDVKIWTHKIDGLTKSDFIFAAKCDPLYQN